MSSIKGFGLCNRSNPILNVYELFTVKLISYCVFDRVLRGNWFQIVCLSAQLSAGPSKNGMVIATQIFLCARYSFKIFYKYYVI